MTTESVIVGRAKVGLIVWTPVPGIAKWIVFGPGVAAFDWRIADRRLPDPKLGSSPVFETIKLARRRRRSKPSTWLGRRTWRRRRSGAGRRLMTVPLRVRTNDGANRTRHDFVVA